MTTNQASATQSAFSPIEKELLELTKTIREFDVDPSVSPIAMVYQLTDAVQGILFLGHILQRDPVFNTLVAKLKAEELRTLTGELINLGTNLNLSANFRLGLVEAFIQSLKHFTKCWAIKKIDLDNQLLTIMLTPDELDAYFEKVTGHVPRVLGKY